MKKTPTKLINLRIPIDELPIIDQAAALRFQNRTEYIRRVCLRDAKRTLKAWENMPGGIKDEWAGGDND